MAKAKYTYNEARQEWATKVWDGTYNKDGSKHRKIISSKKSSGDLEKKVNAFIEEVKAGENKNFSDLSFLEYANKWLETAKSSRSANTIVMYRNIIDTHLSFLGRVPIADIRHSHFQQAINRQLDHPRTCQQISVTFKQIVRAAAKDHIITRTDREDIVSDVSLPAYQKPKKRPLTPLEKEAFLNLKTDPMKMAYISLLYYCGIRKEEALALTPDDFDWTNNEVNIDKTVVFVKNAPVFQNTTKSKNSIRKVPLTEEAIPRIKPYVESCQGSRLFHNKDKDIMTKDGYRRMWDGILTDLNIALGYEPYSTRDRSKRQITGLTAHVFRHNYCTELCYQIPKISTKMIAKLLGDSEKMVLEVYSHIVEEKENVSDTIRDALSIK